MLSLSENSQTDVIEAVNSSPRFPDDLLNIDTPYLDQMVSQIYATQLQLDKAIPFEAGTPILNLDLSITNSIFSSKMYDKRDAFNSERVNFNDALT